METRSLGARLSAVTAAAVLALTGCSTIVFPTDADTGPPGGPQEVQPPTSPVADPSAGPSADDSEVTSEPVSGASAEEESDPGQTPAEDDDASDGGTGSEAASWESVVEDTRSGVVHLSVFGCSPEESGSGSGFLIAPDLVVTAAHVVEGAASTSAAVDEQIRDATVLGLDHEADVALLQLDEPVEGYTFSWAEEDAAIGSDVAALGFPLAGGFSIVSGILSGTEQNEAGHELLRFTAPVNPGNSGGAIVTRDGEAIGVVSSRIEESLSGRPVSGVSYSISYTTARPLVDGWIEAPEPPSRPWCVADVEPFVLTMDIDLSNPDVLVAALIVQIHGEAINSGNYESAFAMFTPQMQEDMGGLDAWSSGLESSFWRKLALTDHTVTEDSVELRMTLRTEQSAEDGPEGMSCTDWDLTYLLVWDSEVREYLIDEVRSQADPTECRSD